MGYQIFGKEDNVKKRCQNCDKEISSGLIETAYETDTDPHDEACELFYCLKCGLPILKDEITYLVKLMRRNIEMRKQELEEETK